MRISRRRFVTAGAVLPMIPLFSGCRANLPPLLESDHREDAQALLQTSATAHGLDVYRTVTDVNAAYAGHWQRLVQRLQPALVDAGYRGGSEERLLLGKQLSGQWYQGPKGRKKVVRSYRGDENRTRVWFNGDETAAQEQIDAAALVADAYWLFLLGPLLLASNHCPARNVQVSLAAPTAIRQGKKTIPCEVLNLVLRPGFGNSSEDRAALYIDRDTRLMRRVRMTLNGLASTQGALVDIDTFNHQTLSGLRLPTAFHERLLRPAPLDVHHWQLIGLDLNRGTSPADFVRANGQDDAGAPAAALPSPTENL